MAAAASGALLLSAPSCAGDRICRGGLARTGDFVGEGDPRGDLIGDRVGDLVGDFDLDEDGPGDFVGDRVGDVLVERRGDFTRAAADGDAGGDSGGDAGGEGGGDTAAPSAAPRCAAVGSGGEPSPGEVCGGGDVGVCRVSGRLPGGERFAAGDLRVAPDEPEPAELPGAGAGPGDRFAGDLQSVPPSATGAGRVLLVSAGPQRQHTLLLLLCTTFMLGLDMYTQMAHSPPPAPHDTGLSQHA